MIANQRNVLDIYYRKKRKMKLVTLVSNNVGVDTYLELRKAVNFKPLSRTQAKKALDNSLYIVCAYIDAKIVGMGWSIKRKA